MSDDRSVSAEYYLKHPTARKPEYASTRAAGMDFFALPNEESERGAYYSLIGVGREAKQMRRIAREWLELGRERITDPENTAALTP